MSALSSSRISEPQDWQAFERASEVLWTEVLGSEVTLLGISGQEQHGVDLTGYRNGEVGHLVGVQCKCKKPGKDLKEEDLRAEVEKALKYKPPLREFILTTTGRDDAKLTMLAQQLAEEQLALGRNIIFRFEGWGTLERRISRYPAAIDAFDPSFGPWGRGINDSLKALEHRTHKGLEFLTGTINSLVASLPTTDATMAIASAIDKELDSTIDEYRDRLLKGKPATAITLFEALFTRLKPEASDRIRFRIKANIGHCQLGLGDEEAAAKTLEEAVGFAPEDPKAIANKVLALALRKDHQAAFDLARAELEKSPDNETLAFYLIQAARFLPTIDEPLVFVPIGLHQKKDVLSSLIDFKRSRGETAGWWDAARHASSLFPADETLEQHAAEAVLDRISRETNMGASRLSAAMREDIAKARDVLAKGWKRVQESEVLTRPDHLALCGNFALAQHVAGDSRAAIETLEVGLSQAPSDEPLIVRLALVAYESGDAGRAKTAFAKLPDQGEAIQVKCQIAARTGNWAYLAKLDRKLALSLPECERTPFKTLLDIARLLHDRPANGPLHLKRLITERAGCARSSVLLARAAQELGMLDEELKAYGNAMAAVTDDSHISGRSMIAGYASSRDDQNVVASMLDGHVATDIDSEELRMLARAFAHIQPPTQRAFEFFNDLPQSIRDLDHYLSCEGSLHFQRGSLEDAERCFRALHSRSPSQLWPILCLFQTYVRVGNSPEIARLLEDLTPSNVRGTADQRMAFSHALLHVGREAEALALGYEMLRANANDADFHLRYIGLLVGGRKRPEIPSPTTVAVGCWVRVDNEVGEGQELLIELGKDRPADGLYGPAHPLVMALIGKQVGDEYATPGTWGMIHQGRILEIKHRYLHALHDSMENFNRRFPGHPGLRRVLTRDDDISPVLDILKRQGEHVEQLLRTYADKSLPLAFIAGGWEHATAFASTVRATGGLVHTSIGLIEERDTTMEWIAAARGAVLDTFTFMTAADLGALDVLKLVFPKLVAPRALADDLASLKPNLAGEQQGRMGCRGGQYFIEEHLRDDVEAFARELEERERSLKEYCDILPVSAPNELPNLARVILDAFDKNVLDPLFLANEHDLILLSEDLGYRKTATGILPVRGAWLQAVFLYAAETNLISQARYTDLVEGLARRRHSHLAIDARLLLQAHRSDDRTRFEAVVDHIGTRHAEIYSHLRVSLEFLAPLWRRRSPTTRDLAVTGRILECLVRHRPKDWNDILDVITSRLPQAKAYVRGWAKGHFLSWPIPAAANDTAAIASGELRSRGKKARPRGR